MADELTPVPGVTPGTPGAVGTGAPGGPAGDATVPGPVGASGAPGVPGEGKAKKDINMLITPPLDGSPVKTQVERPNVPWHPKTVAEHNAWVDSLAAEEGPSTAKAIAETASPPDSPPEP